MPSDGRHSYSYDARDRLVAVDGGATAAYRYNALGQRVYKRARIEAAAVTPGLLSGIASGKGASSAAYDCNGDGKVDKKDIACLARQMGQSAKGGGLKRGGGASASQEVTLYFAYDEAGQLLGEYDATGAPLSEIIWLGGMPVALLRGGEVYNIHPDHLGTPRAVTNQQAQVVWRWDSEPFGTTLANEDPGATGHRFRFNLRFPGQYFDAETGLHYNYFRDYDPRTGRYLTSDLIGLQGGLNTYSYVEGNPLLYIDPLGLAGLLGPHFDTSHPDYHDYEYRTPVCSLAGKGCSVDSVYEQLRRFPAPGYSGSCAILNGDLGDIPFLGGVAHLVDDAQLAVANVTSPGHLLHPGKVVRNVEVEKGWIYVRTFGDGTGRFGTLNEALRGVVWRPVDARIRTGMRTYLSDWKVSSGSVACGCEK